MEPSGSQEKIPHSDSVKASMAKRVLRKMPGLQLLKGQTENGIS